MTWLADTAFEESERFVGRTSELQQFQAWLHDSHPLTQLWDVHGIAGMGKSTLLWQWMAHARRQQVPSVWMDGRSCPKQPVQFLDHLFDITENVLPISPRKKISWPERFLWVIDNFDDLESLEAWLREDLIARLPEQGGLLVFASRRGLSAHWHVHPIWASRMRKLPLKPWTLYEARTYFHRLGLKMTEELQQVLRPLHGHPLSMAVAGEYFTRRGTVMNKRDYSFLETITAELLREVTDSQLHPFLDILTVLPSANQDMITAIAEPLVISTQQYRDLSRLSFVRLVPSGLALHDVVRSQLLASMQEHHPMTLKHLRLKALDYLGTLYRQSQSGSEKNHLGYLLLEITAQSLPISSPYANIAAIDEIVRENQLKEGDLECLHSMIEHWGRQSLDMPSLAVAHAFLDDIARNIDDGIRIFRAPSGEPVAFFASLPLYQKTVDLIERYVPGSVARYFPHDTEFPRDRDQVDTFFGVLVGVKPDDPRYHAHDLLGILIRDGLSHLGRGLRGVIGVSEPNFKELLELLGFIAHPIDAEQGIYAFTLDMRQRDFLLWVGSIVQALNRPAIRMQYPVDENLLRRVLKALHDPGAFRKTAIADILGCQPEEARYILQSLLTKAPVPPLTENEQNLLRLTFVERIGNADSIALALHLSRPTYYRMLKQSLVNLCTVLQSGDFLSATLE
ncbi:MAG: hypothetical protein C7B47_03600 [Sulfobacillus thermosulfidooxidans]|uniref:ATP-binding protein n=1 Tax=Sulfobacillus thermosulfidooxidans TaxID=28034 RepID=A0A2T2X3H6_SULTH|nr:MAG: hypothetical protein C7B47_03600 [Sulfobacillus thermosulfidooxidans]